MTSKSNKFILSFVLTIFCMACNFEAKSNEIIRVWHHRHSYDLMNEHVVEREVISFNGDAFTDMPEPIKAIVSMYSTKINLFFTYDQQRLATLLGDYNALEEAQTSLMNKHMPDYEDYKLFIKGIPSNLTMIKKGNRFVFWYAVFDPRTWQTKRADVFELNSNNIVEYVESWENLNTNSDGKITSYDKVKNKKE